MEPGGVKTLFEGEPLGIELILRMIEAETEAFGRIVTRTINRELPQKYGFTWTDVNFVPNLLPPTDGTTLPAERLVHARNDLWGEKTVRDFTKDHVTLANLVKNNYPQRLEDSFPAGSTGRKLSHELFQPYNWMHDAFLRNTLTLAVLESLPLIPKGTGLPGNFYSHLEFALKSGWYDNQTIAAIAKNALSSKKVPLSYKRQIAEGYVRSLNDSDTDNLYSIDVLAHSYEVTGKGIAKLLRDNIVSIMNAGLAQEQVFDAYKALAGIYGKKDGANAKRRFELIRNVIAGAWQLNGGVKRLGFEGKRKTASELPLAALENYVEDLNLLNEFKAQFPASKLELSETLEPPFEQLSMNFEFPQFAFLKAVNNEGKLTDRRLNDFLRPLFNRKNASDFLRSPHAVITRNLKELLNYDFPIKLDATDGIPIDLPETYFRDSVKSVDAVSKKHPETALPLFYALRQIHDIFGDKAQAVVDYFEKDRNREQLRALMEVDESHVKPLRRRLSRVDLQPSRTQTKKVVKIATAIYALEVAKAHTGTETGLKICRDVNSLYERVEGALAEVGRKLGFSADDMMKFLPWVKSKDPIAMQVLQGQTIRKNGPEATYQLANEKVSLDEMCDEVTGYANIVGALVAPMFGKRIADLAELKKYAKAVMSIMEGKKKEIPQQVYEEIRPNLDRIITFTGKSGTYFLDIEPSNIKAQMDALQNIPSCLTPGGSHFRYTQGYFQNPNVSWATIRDVNGKVAGRVTLFYGEDQNERQAVARVSRIYANTAIGEAAVDSALQSYARQNNLVLLRAGPMKIPGLMQAYDDYVTRSPEMAKDIVMVNIGKQQPSSIARMPELARS